MYRKFMVCMGHRLQCKMQNFSKQKHIRNTECSNTPEINCCSSCALYISYLILAMRRGGGAGGGGCAVTYLQIGVAEPKKKNCPGMLQSTMVCFTGSFRVLTRDEQ